MEASVASKSGISKIFYQKETRTLVIVNADPIKQAWVEAQKTGTVASEFLTKLTKFEGACYFNSDSVCYGEDLQGLIARAKEEEVAAKKTKETAAPVIASSGTAISLSSSSSSMGSRSAENITASASSSSSSSSSSSTSSSSSSFVYSSLKPWFAPEGVSGSDCYWD